MLAKVNNAATTTTTLHTADDSISETSTDEDIVDIPSPCAPLTGDDTADVSMSEDPGAITVGELGTGVLPASVIIPNDVGIESFELDTTAVGGMLEHAGHSQPLAFPVPSHVGSPQHADLTDEQVAFAIVSALAAVPTPSTSLQVVAVQGVPSMKVVIGQNASALVSRHDPS